MEAALVPELRKWITENRKRLKDQSISIVEKLPPEESKDQSKGCIELDRAHMILSVAVWDRTPIPIDLLVYNSETKNTVVMKDYYVNSVSEVLKELTEISTLLFQGKYDDLPSI